MTTQANAKDYLSPQAAILIPAGQATVSAFAIGVTSGSVAALLHATNPWAVGALAGGISLGVTWAIGLSWWRGRLESFQQAATPAQVFASDTVRLEIFNSDNPHSPYMRGAFNDITISQEALEWAIIHLANGGDLSMGAMTGPGKISRSEFVTIRDVLIDNDLAAWKNPRAHAQGSVMLVAGRHAARRYITANTTPPANEMALIPARPL